MVPFKIAWALKGKGFPLRSKASDPRYKLIRHNYFLGAVGRVVQDVGS